MATIFLRDTLPLLALNVPSKEDYEKSLKYLRETQDDRLTLSEDTLNEWYGDTISNSLMDVIANHVWYICNYTDSHYTTYDGSLMSKVMGQLFNFIYENMRYYDFSQSIKSVLKKLIDQFFENYESVEIVEEDDDGDAEEIDDETEAAISEIDDFFRVYLSIPEDDRLLFEYQLNTLHKRGKLDLLKIAEELNLDPEFVSNNFVNVNNHLIEYFIRKSA